MLLAVHHWESVAAGRPEPWSRVLAFSVFFIAATTDGLDGWAARKYNARTRLGSILDPIADKGLLLAGFLTLYFCPWSAAHSFPRWFMVIILMRDIISVAATFFVRFAVGHVEVRPHWSGKTCTVAQIVAVCWIMLQWEWIPPIVPLVVAAAFTVLTGIVYIGEGKRQMIEFRSRKRPDAG